MAPSNNKKKANTTKQKTGNGAAKIYECPSCKKVCGNKGALALHIKKMHGNKQKLGRDKVAQNSRKVSRAKDGRKLPLSVDQPYMRRFVEERKQIEEKNIVKKEKLLKKMQKKSVPTNGEVLAKLQDELEFSHKLVNHYNGLLLD